MATGPSAATTPIIPDGREVVEAEVVGVGGSRGTARRIAYLTSQYPAASHSFVRREIEAVEAAGVEVRRFSVRPPAATLPDPADRREAAVTRVVLDQGAAKLLAATLAVAVTRPRRFAGALGLVLSAVRRYPAAAVRQLAYLAEACWLSRELTDVTHLHAHFGTNPAAVARLVNRLTDLPYSFTVHGPDEFDAPREHDLPGKVADAEAVMAISSFGRSQLMRWSDPAHWAKLAVVRCGVDRLFTDEPPAGDRTAPQLACVARLSAQKGLPLLIEAAAELVRDGTDFRLVLVGDGEMRSQIEAQIARAGMSDRVTITGMVAADAVRRILLDSRAMVLPSFAEGLPVVIMEALALRTPVVVSAIAGTPELVDAECGWLVPAGDVSRLADAMRAALAATPEALARMGDVGRKRVLRMHDAGRNGAQLARLVRAA